MKPSELSAAMREMADRIDAAGMPESMNLDCRISSHKLSSLESMRAIRRLMDVVRADNGGGTHWICNYDVYSGGKFIEVVGYYDCGLLGGTVREKVVEREESPDLSLLEEPANA